MTRPDPHPADARKRPVAGPVLTPACEAFLAAVSAAVEARPPQATVERIEALVRAHDRWRGAQCLNMNPAEGLLSRRVRAVLASDMAARLTEGLPGDKTFPHYRLNDTIDEIEATIIGLTRKLFGARFVEWRPVSTSMANAAVFFALLQAGDTVLVQGLEGGGNYSYQSQGPLGLTGATVAPIPPCGELFEIDLDWVRTEARVRRPKMIVVGGSKVLFPYPLGDLRAIADEVGAVLVYDAAHLGLLISGGDFQRPLQEGAHVVTLSTHKVMGGPVGGMVLTDDPAIAEQVIKLTFPALMQTRDQNKYAALAIALAEADAFGPTLARQMVANANALGEALAARGYRVLAGPEGFTRTHQLFLDLGAGAATFERRCQDANILIPDCALTGDIGQGRRSGARVATHELSRLGMVEADMAAVAQLIHDANAGVRSAAALQAEVGTLLSRFPGIPSSFDGTPPQAESRA